MEVPFVTVPLKKVAASVGLWLASLFAELAPDSFLTLPWLDFVS
jgi:hypothetical protein